LETIAVYWEDRIKTYGFAETAGLSLLRWTALPDELPGLGSGMEEEGAAGIGMLLVLGQGSEAPSVTFGLLVERQWEERMTRRLRDLLSGRSRGSVTGHSPAGLIHFYGPHFGDRYGIADAGLRVLADRDIPMLAMACSASSIYLVVPEARMEAAKNALAEVFVRPGE
jgi:aspartokinase